MSHNHINPWVMEDKTNKPISPAVCCFIPVLILDRLQDLSTRTHSGQNTFQLFFEKCLESVLSVSWPRYLFWEPVRGALLMTTFTTRTGTLCGMLSPRALKTSSFCLSNHPLAPWSLCNPKDINSSQKNSQACDDLMSLNLQIEASKDIPGAQRQSLPQKNTEHVCPWYQAHTTRC